MNTRKEFHQILYKWRNNELTFAQATQKLLDVGFSLTQAHDILART